MDEGDFTFSDNLEDVKTGSGFAFMAIELTENDFESIAPFRKVIKNYQKIIKLEKVDG